MRTIYKYYLLTIDVQTFHMPKGAKMLSVGEQNGDICLWAMVETDHPKVTRKISMHGTGRPLAYPSAEFIGTVSLYDASLTLSRLRRRGG